MYLFIAFDVFKLLNIMVLFILSHFTFILHVSFLYFLYLHLCHHRCFIAVSLVVVLTRLIYKVCSTFFSTGQPFYLLYCNKDIWIKYCSIQIE